MEKASGMAIPTMFNSSARILVGKGGSILYPPEEEAHVQAADKDLDSLVPPGAPLPGMDEPGTEEEPCCASIIAQEEGDESEDFSPNCMNFYQSKVFHHPRSFVSAHPSRGEDFSETQEDDLTWGPDHYQRRRKRQKKKNDPVRERWSERWREVQTRERAKGEIKERVRRRRRILSDPCELASSSDEGTHTSRAHYRLLKDQLGSSQGRSHRVQPRLLSPPPDFADRKAPLWESPSLDSLGSLYLSQSPPSACTTDSSLRHLRHGALDSSNPSTLPQVGFCASCFPSGGSQTVSPSNTPDSTSPSLITSRWSSDTVTADSGGSCRRCLSPRFPGTSVSISSSSISMDQGSTTVSSNSNRDYGGFSAKLKQSLSCMCIRTTLPFTSGGSTTDMETSSSCCTLTRSFVSLDSSNTSICSRLCGHGKHEADRGREYCTESSISSLDSSSLSYTSASTAYTVSRSFDTPPTEETDSTFFANVRAGNQSHKPLSQVNSISIARFSRKNDCLSSSVGKTGFEFDTPHMIDKKGDDSPYMSMTGGQQICHSVELYCDSRCSSSETVFQSDTSCNTVQRSFASYEDDDSDAVYMCMDGRRSSRSDTARDSDSDSSLYSVERSLDSPFETESAVVAVCTCRPVEADVSEGVEVYPNLYCSETDNGLTSTATTSERPSAATSEVSLCDSSCSCNRDSDSLCTSAIAEWGSLSVNDTEQSGILPSATGAGNFGDSLNTPLQYLSDSSLSSSRDSDRRDGTKALAETLETGMQLDCPDGLASHLERLLRDLRGVVTQSDRRLVSPFFRELVREAGDDGDGRKNHANEGFLFHPQKLLQPKNRRYCEGHQYSLLQHIQNGSYGDVYSAVDLNTGFKCAAKKVPLCSFSWEEVGTWSGLSSPRVLQLFGAVREGPNIILFMDLKTGSLAQLLRSWGSLPEDLALHYHIQVLEALEHLHRRHVLHLDIKVDNVLLSEDGRDCFLCDFGLSEMLDTNGQAPRAFRGYGLRGTESHMAPEVARGDTRGAKADVWSSCCMLLHMLNGCHPWTRYYAHPLCLTIATEDPPLREVPESCHPMTMQVFWGGLVKDPGERASSMELKEKSRKALRAVGGLTSAIGRAPPLPEPETKHSLYQEQLSPTPKEPSPPSTDVTSCSSDIPKPLVHWLSSWRERAQEEEGSDSEEEEGWSNVEEEREKWEEEESEDEEEEEDEGSDLESLRGKGSDWLDEEEWEPLHRLQILYGPKDHPQNGSNIQIDTQRDSRTRRKWPGMRSPSLPHRSSSQTHGRISCHTPDSQLDSSEKESNDWSDELSSGVFSSYNSQTDRESFNVDWLVSSNQPPSCCFDGLGVDIWIEDFSGQRFRIRERPQVKVGHVAIGISNQISERTFCLASLDGKLSRPDEEVQESGMWLQCVDASDDCPAWTWRIRDGQLEERS